MAATAWRLSPSDFAFLWEECKRCFYLKVAQRFDRPRPIMPKIFNVIDQQMNQRLAGRRTDSITAGMPVGSVDLGERWVRSDLVPLPSGASCFISGKFDTVVRLDDGSIGVIDFKTSDVKAEHVSLYGRQLHAYAYALEHPAQGALRLGPITRLGLLVFQPVTFENNQPGNGLLSGGLTWIEIPQDNSKFLGFLADVDAVLNLSAPPSGAPTCEWCSYRNTSRLVAV